MATATTKAAACSEEEAFDILDQLIDILERHPLIDEVGFVHPSQIQALSEDVNTGSLSTEVFQKDEVLDNNDVQKKRLAFWHGDDKLGISTHFLPLLYIAAKHKFMAALMNYRILTEASKKQMDGDDQDIGISHAFSKIEMEVIRHSKALLLLCGDFGTAWNARKYIGTSKQNLLLFMDELQLSTLILSFAPKTECAWSHRRWVIKMLAGKCANLEEILEQESLLVEKLAEKSKMNYRAWNHRSRLVAYMSKQQMLHELAKSRNWAGLHVADSSCFHYRRRLMLRMLDDAMKEQDLIVCNAEVESLSVVWKEELDWNEVLIRRYIGHEALWFHRRFLSICWAEKLIGHFSISNGDETLGHNENHLSVFMEHELQLHRQCSIVQDSEFDDYTKQAVLSAAYILYLHTQFSERLRIQVVDKRQADDLRTLLHNVCPEKNSLWDYFLQT
ncbi:prenyltransferase alpha subunit repeat-containing protein [Drosera capensis]